MSSTFSLNIDLDNINQSAALLFRCQGSPDIGPSGPAYTTNTSGYYICPLCYEYELTDDPIPIAEVSDVPNDIPNLASLLNEPASSPSYPIIRSETGYSWSDFDNVTTNEVFTIWCHLYNLNTELTGPSGSTGPTLFPTYQSTLDNLMSQYIDSLQYKNLTPTVAMLYSQSKMFGVINTSYKTVTSATIKKLNQKNVRILMDDVYDYTVVPYDANSDIQKGNTTKFVLTKTLLRFLELFNSALIDPTYDLLWFNVSEGVDDITISDTDGAEPVVISNIPVSISSNSDTYYINTKSAKCLINFLTSFGSYID